MRIVLFTETFLPRLDGITTVVCLLLEHLAKRGIESLIVTPRYGDVRSYAQTRVITLPSLAFPLYPEVRLAPSTPAVYRELQAFQPHVAHFIHPIVTGMSGMWMARRLNIPMLASFHLHPIRLPHLYKIGWFEPIARWLTLTAFNAADVRLAPSRLLQRDMEAIGVQPIDLWGRGVDAEKFHPRHRSEAMRAELSDGYPDAPILLYVGRLAAEKQIELLKPLVERVPGVRLALVGDGPARGALQALFAGLPVRFMGYLSGERLSQAYASADLFVFPSALESFGLVVTEAMAAGLPVVASRVGGVPEVIQEGVTGYTFEVGDIDGLVRGVQTVLHGDRRAAMAQAARAYAETQTWDVMMDQVVAHYEALTRNGR